MPFAALGACRPVGQLVLLRGLIAAAWLAWASLVQGAPLDLKTVSADASWVVHVDFDACRASTVVQNVCRQWTATHKDAERRLAEVRRRWNIDPCQDLHAATFYGKQISREAGVAIVRATLDRQRLLAKAKELPDHRLSRHGPYDVYTWTVAKGTPRARSMSGAFFQPGVLVFAGQAAEVTATLDVLDGTTPNLAGKHSVAKVSASEDSASGDSVMTAPVPAGTMVLARAVRLSEANLPWKSPLLTQSDTLSIVWGEDRAVVFFEGRLTVKTDDAAEQMKAIIEGGRAMATIRYGSDPQTMKLLDALKVAKTGKAHGDPLAGAGRPGVGGPGESLAARGGNRPATGKVAFMPRVGPPPSPSDEELARRAQQGCAVSWEELLRRFQSPLLHFLRQRAGAADAEDLLQDTFVRVYANLHRYRRRWRVATWLFTIARRVSINHQHRPRPQGDAQVWQQAVSAGPGPVEAAVEEESRRYLWGMAARVLSEEELTALWLHYVEELPLREVAVVLDRSGVAVKTMMFRARRRLLPLLGELAPEGPPRRAAKARQCSLALSAVTKEVPDA